MEIIKILERVGALLHGHFVGASGRHLDTYINKDALYPNTKEVSKVGRLIAQKNKNLNIDVIVAPALGGIILSQWTAYHLSKLKKKKILGIYTEKDKDDNQVLRRGYDKLVKGKNILIVEDITTTGGSVKKVIESVRMAGGKVKRASVMVNRDSKNVNSTTIGALFSSLGILAAKSWDKNDCPMCKKGIPIDTQVGHGRL